MAPPKRSSSRGSVSRNSTTPSATPEPIIPPSSSVSALPDTSISSNNENNGQSEQQQQPNPPPLPTIERLFHAEINLELTAEPVTQLIADMAAQAVQNISAKAAAAPAAASSSSGGDGAENNQPFDWVTLAQEAIREAEVTAKRAVLDELVGPIAQRAWVQGRKADELEVGTPVVRDDGSGGVVKKAKGRGRARGGGKKGKKEARPAAAAAAAVTGRDGGDTVIEKGKALDVVVEAGGEAGAGAVGGGDVETEHGALVTRLKAQDQEGSGEEKQVGGSSVAENDVLMTGIGRDEQAGGNAVAKVDAQVITSGGEVQYVEQDPTRPLCYCFYPANGELMYGCDNPNCRHEWYHEICLQRAVRKKDLPKPDQGWLCPYCGDYGVKRPLRPWRD